VLGADGAEQISRTRRGPQLNCRTLHWNLFHEAMKPLQWLSIFLALSGLLWCLVVGERIWTTPVRLSGVEWAMGPTGSIRTIERVGVRSFSDISGLGVIPLFVPVLLAGWATWAAWGDRIRTLTILTLVFLAFCFIAGFSIGGAYWPAAGALVAATLLGALRWVGACDRKTAV